MFNKIFFPTIILILSIWFFLSPEFKEISAWVAIFLFWMKFLEQWFKTFTWGTLERILQKTTNKTWKSIIFWAISATIMQSSSLVSLLAISFLSAELISLIQWIWILFWANIWTTTWAWLIAAFWMKINISVYAMPMLVFWILFSFQKSKILKWIWSISAWLGFLFLWIHYMKEWFDSFQNSINLIDYAMEWFVWVLVFVWIWILATIVMQSSHATIILVIAALATWQVSYENALALVIWANIWTTITAVIWSLTSNINWKRLAISDVLFKVTTWIFFIAFIWYISDFVNILSWIFWIAEDNYTLKLALFHTLFNLVWLILIIPFMSSFVKVIFKIFPDKAEKDVNTPIYLNKSTLELPDTSIISLIKETKNLYNKSIDLILNSLWLTTNDLINTTNKDELIKKINVLDLESIEKLYNTNIKVLYSEIVDFIANAQTINSKKYSDSFYKIKLINIKIIENIKYIQELQKNISKYLKSSNENIKDEYSKMIFDLVDILKDIYELSIIKDKEEKLLLMSKIELTNNSNDEQINKNINKFIRNNLITSQMASSIINDSHYKNQIFSNLSEISQVLFNNKILNDGFVLKKNKDLYSLFNNIFWLSDKKLEKIITKLKNRKYNLSSKLKKEKSKIEISKTKRELELIDYTIKKYK